MGRLLKIKNLIKIGLQAKLRLAQYRHILPANTLSAKYSIHGSLPRSKKNGKIREDIAVFFFGKIFLFEVFNEYFLHNSISVGSRVYAVVGVLFRKAVFIVHELRKVVYVYYGIFFAVVFEHFV